MVMFIEITFAIKSMNVLRTILKDETFMTPMAANERANCDSLMESVIAIQCILHT